MNDQQHTTAICQEIQAITQKIKADFPFLRHQNLLGLGIFTLAIGCILVAMYLYAVTQQINALITIVWIAFWTSILHELEHDLIHKLYFKQNLWLHNFMLLGVWLFRPLTLNPWMRRYIHYHHHKYSGTASDIEERGLNNGMAWGFLRLITTADLLLAGALRSKDMRQEVRDLYKQGYFTSAEVKNLRRITLWGFLPMGIPLHLLWYSFLLYYFWVGLMGVLVGYFSVTTPWVQYWAGGGGAALQSYMGYIEPLMVLLVMPNLWRQFCLHFITSNMHYYGDVERGNILQQTQVLNAWYFWPFQLFCFNFGSTHSIHHFVVNETFYVRQLTAAKVHNVLEAHGVRFNDLGTFWRANRYYG